MKATSVTGISTHIASRFKLDGGAMFGALPKSLWQRRIPADEKNRISLVARLLCIETDDGMMVVDAGMGTHWNEKMREIYDLKESEGNLRDTFPNLTRIVLSHLHLDHAGGVTGTDETGTAAAAVTGVEFVVSATQQCYVTAPCVREAGSYRDCEKDVIFSAAQSGNSLRIVQDGDEIVPGVLVHELFGHTEGMLAVLARYKETTYAFLSDLVPTSHHLHIPDVMGYDICPKTTVNEKNRILSQAVDENWVIVFAHDPDIAACTLRRDDRGRFAVNTEVTL